MQKKFLILSILAFSLSACATTEVKEGPSSENARNTFESFVANYAKPSDTGDGTIYKFIAYSPMMKTYDVGVQSARFFKWCSANGYKFSENGDLALRTKLRSLYPTESIKEGFVCGDGQGGFYGFAHFAGRNQTAFLKAGSLNSRVAIDFWPEKGNPQDFWPNRQK